MEVPQNPYANITKSFVHLAAKICFMKNCWNPSPMSAATGACTRHYHPTLSIWLSVDPMADKYPGVSPYAYCGNNPVRLVDEDGREINPVFNWYGDFLGYDDAGKGGIPIIMEGSHFSPGMSHQQAMDNMKHDINRGLGLTEEGKSKIINFYLEHSASPGSTVEKTSFWDDFVDMLNHADIACRGHADNSRWEGHGDYWDRKFAEAVEPYATAAVSMTPGISQINDLMTINGEDMFGNPATKFEKVGASVSLVAVGASKIPIKAVQSIATGLGWGTKIYTAGNTWNNERKKIER